MDEEMTTFTCSFSKHGNNLIKSTMVSKERISILTVGRRRMISPRSSSGSALMRSTSGGGSRSASFLRLVAGSLAAAGGAG
jgi:hypothetical protein